MTYCLFLIGYLSSIPLEAHAPFVLDASRGAFQLASHTQMLNDSTSNLTIEQIKGGQYAFQPVDGTHVNVGFSTACHWLRFSVVSLRDQQYYLSLHDSMLDEVLFYQVNRQGNTTLLRLGDNFPFGERPVLCPDFVLPLKLRANQPITVYLRVRSRDAIQLAMWLQTETAFLESMSTENLIMGFYLGASILVIIYNLLLFLLIRDGTYLYYLAFLIPFFLASLAIEGLAFQYLWPDWPWLGNMANTFFSGVAAAACIGFSIHFLNLQTYLPVRTLYLYYALMGLGLVISLLAGCCYKVGLNVFIAYYLVISCAVLFGSGLYVLRRGYSPGGFYLTGWGLFFVFASLFMLRNTSLIASDFIVMPHGYQATFLIQQIIFTYGIGYRMREYKREKEINRIRLLEQLLENEQTRNRIARDLHDDLGSTLSSISILSGLSLPEARLSNLSAAELLWRIHTSAQNILERMRDIVWATRPEHDDLVSLVNRMREFAVPLLEARQIGLTFRVETRDERLQLPAHANYDLYVVFKEAVNNIIKYAEATLVQCSIGKCQDELILEVLDNGVGFEQANVSSGNGLVNMEKRAQVLGGKLTVTSIQGQGTRITLKIPFKPFTS